MPGPERAGTRTGPSGALSAGWTRCAGRFSTEEGVAEGPDRMGRRRDRTNVSLDLAGRILRASNPCPENQKRRARSKMVVLTEGVRKCQFATSSRSAASVQTNCNHWHPWSAQVSFRETTCGIWDAGAIPAASISE